MARRNGNKSFKKARNKGNHQRKRTTRGYRKMSKFKKYKWYTEIKGGESDEENKNLSYNE
jgi:hypothetical protein